MCTCAFVRCKPKPIQNIPTPARFSNLPGEFHSPRDKRRRTAGRVRADLVSSPLTVPPVTGAQSGLGCATRPRPPLDRPTPARGCSAGAASSRRAPRGAGASPGPPRPAPRTCAGRGGRTPPDAVCPSAGHRRGQRAARASGRGPATARRPRAHVGAGALGPGGAGRTSGRPQGPREAAGSRQERVPGRGRGQGPGAGSRAGAGLGAAPARGRGASPR